MAKLQHTIYTTSGLDAFDTASLTKGYLLSSNSVKKAPSDGIWSNQSPIYRLSGEGIVYPLCWLYDASTWVSQASSEWAATTNY